MIDFVVLPYVFTLFLALVSVLDVESDDFSSGLTKKRNLISSETFIVSYTTLFPSCRMTGVIEPRSYVRITRAPFNMPTLYVEFP